MMGWTTTMRDTKKWWTYTVCTCCRGSSNGITQGSFFKMKKSYLQSTKRCGHCCILWIYIPDRSCLLPQRLKPTLAPLPSQALLSQRPSSPSRSPSRSSASTPRVVSPAPSTSSSSSSLSTTSTHTVVPRTCPTALSAASQSTTSTSSNSTITQRTDATKSKGANGHAIAHRHRPGNRDRDPDTMPGARALSDARRVSPSAYTLIKASLGPYLTTSNLTTFLILFIVFPLLSFVLRVRRRKLRASAENPTTGSTANQVRRRLGATGNWGLIGKLWQEVVRSVGDTIRMGGQGLV